ncbi:MAG: UbiA prenyltransferase family protein [Saprospiraceae bacterium]|nr:UbiA prenyltransferase family protein [Saprospiraceae bacterium]
MNGLVNNESNSVNLQIFRLLRILHWSKNLLIFFPLFFAGKLTAFPLLMQCTLGFLFFSLTASGVYVFNDIRDIRFDQNHPEKKLRPVAQGLISPASGLMVASILVVMGLAGAFWTYPPFFILLSGYVVLTLIYTFWIKNIAILDVLLLSLNYVLRIYAGGLLAGVAISPWLIVMVYLLALLLALSKRHHDLTLSVSTDARIRPSLNGYSPGFVKSMINYLSAVLTVCYLIYIIMGHPQTPYHQPFLILTALPVLYGIFRYQQSIFMDQGAADPIEYIFKDIPMLFSLIIWLLLFSISLYAAK